MSLICLIHVCLFAFGLLLNNGIVSGQVGPTIPNRDEQQRVLAHVQAIFEYAKEMVKEENVLTDAAVINDVQKIVRRAQNKLALAEEMALIKLSCSKPENTILLDTKSTIQKATQEGYDLLDHCTITASTDIRKVSSDVTSIIAEATNNGQHTINLLEECSMKNTLQQIICYKRVMNEDVGPLRENLIQSMLDHKRGHKKTVEVRDSANDCVDRIMDIYQAKLAQIMADEVLVVYT